MMTPIFIFGLPRTGSTLLQRVLMAHPEINSVSEPHIVLPLAYTLKEEGLVSEYMHQNVHRATEDLIGSLENKDSEYYALIRKFVLDVYQSLSKKETRYFLDKTPNYHFIIPEIAKIFPDAKFIFLFRNPVQALASSIETFGGGKLRKVERFYIGTNKYFANLSKGYVTNKQRSIGIQYEQFVENPEKELKSLLNYLDLEYDASMLDQIGNQKLSGRLGDPTGVKMYNSINASTVNKWKKTFNSRFRRKLLRKYMDGFSENSLKDQGYSKKTIMLEINDLPTNGSHKFFEDYIGFIKIKLIERLKLNLFFAKHMKWVRSSYLN